MSKKDILTGVLIILVVAGISYASRHSSPKDISDEIKYEYYPGEIGTLPPPSERQNELPLFQDPHTNFLSDNTLDDSNGSYIGLIKAISNSSLTIDYVNWISCTEDCPDGYAIANPSPKLRTFPISLDVRIRLQTYSHIDGSLNYNQQVSLNDFVSIFNSGTESPQREVRELDPAHRDPEAWPYYYRPEDTYYWILLKRAKVVAIEEQYRP